MPAEQKQLIRASQIAAHKTPSAPESPLSLCYVTDREREERSGIAHAQKTWTPAVSFNVGYLILRAFGSRNDRLKPLQSFLYTLYFEVLVKTMHCSDGHKVLRVENETNLVLLLADI